MKSCAQTLVNRSQAELTGAKSASSTVSAKFSPCLQSNWFFCAILQRSLHIRVDRVPKCECPRSWGLDQYKRTNVHYERNDWSHPYSELNHFSENHPPTLSSQPSPRCHIRRGWSPSFKLHAWYSSGRYRDDQEKVGSEDPVYCVNAVAGFRK